MNRINSRGQEKKKIFFPCEFFRLSSHPQRYIFKKEEKKLKYAYIIARVANVLRQNIYSFFSHLNVITENQK